MQGNLVESLMGAVVLIVAAAFLFFAYTRVDVGSVAGYQLSAKFDRIDGLTVGSDVRLSGIKVGTVLSQSLDPDTYDAVVRFTVARGVKLPEDTSARITTEGLLGGTYILLEPGFEEILLADGDIIPIEHTQGALDLTSLIGQYIFSSSGD